MPIPRFNPGTPNVNLTQITRFSPSGSAAQAEMWGQVAKDMGQVASTYGEIERRRVLTEQETAGKVAAADPNFDPNQLRQKVITSADAAYRKGAVASYMAQLDTQKSAAFTAINAESFEDPALLRRRMEQYIDATAAKMPLEVAIEYKQGALREADAYYANSMSAASGRARSQQKDDIKAGIELSEMKLKDLGVPSNPAAQAAYELEAAKLDVKYRQAVEAGVMAPNEVLVRGQVLKQDLEDGTIYQSVIDQPSAARFDFAMKVAEGKSGTGLDLLPADRRYRAVQIAQQTLNAEAAQEKIMEMAQTKQAEEAVWKASELVAANPGDPRAAQTVNRLMALANTPETVQQAAKLRSYVANPGDPRFAKSNPEYMEYLELEAARGRLTQQQVDSAWGDDNLNTRVSTADRQKLSKLLQVRPKGIVGTNAWDTYVTRLEAEFPVRERRRTGMSALFAQLGINVPQAGQTGPSANGLTDAQMRANEGLVKQVLLETQEKIASGDIASENSLTEYGGKRISELRQYFGGAGANAANRPVTYAPSQQGAVMLMQTRPTIQQQYDRYKVDREAFARDASNGTLDVQTINTISRMLEGEKK